jgi:molybdopterin synthase catalytic subunit
MKKSKSIFVEGQISPSFIADSIAKHSSKKNIGAHDIFLGQVRNDLIDDKEVVGIEYTSHQEMADASMLEIRENAFEKFDLTCLHVYHSLGEVKAGEICLFVFVSSKHRQAAFDACQYLVEKIKFELPIFGKELFEDSSSQWKINN